MKINEKGEVIRDQEAPDVEQDSERQKLMQEAAELTERQNQEPEVIEEISSEKKAEIRRRLLGE